MAKPARQSKHDDLLAAAHEFQDGIRAAYRAHEQHRPVMLFDIQEMKVYALPYADYRKTLSKRSQSLLAKEYEQAGRENRIVVFIRDSETRRLVSFLLDRGDHE